MTNIAERSAGLIVFVVGLLLVAHPLRGDIVFLNDGAEVRGAVAQVDATQVRVRRDGAVEEFPLDRVLKIRFLRELGVPGETTPAEVAHPVLRRFLDAPPALDAFPGSGHVTVLRQVDLELRADGSSVKTVRVAKYLLKERGLDEANVTVGFLPPRERAEVLFARSVSRGRIHALDDTLLKDAASYTAYPAYDRHRSLKFAIPNAVEGALIDYSYRVTTDRHDGLHPFTESFAFEGEEPQLNVEVTVRTPPGVRLAVRAERLPVAPVVEETASGTVLRLSLTDMPARLPEMLPAPWWRDRPCLHVGAGTSWDDIRDALRRAVEAAAATLPEDVKAQVAELKAGGSGPGVVERVMWAVNREVSFVGVAARSYSLEPKPVAETRRTRQGNPLDKAVYLWALLREAGVAADLVYVVEKAAGRVWDDVPGLNDALGAVVWTPEAGFLAPYADTYVPGMVPESLQGSRALQVTGRAGFVEIPLGAPATEEYKVRRTLILDDEDALDVDETIESTGSLQRSYRRMKDMPLTSRNRAMEGMVAGIDSKASMLTYRLDNLDDPFRPVVTGLRYRIADAASKGGPDLRLLDLPGLWLGDSSYVAKSERANLLVFAGRAALDYGYEVRVPRGFRLYHRPEDLTLTNPYFSFVARWTPTVDGVDFTCRYERLAVEVPAEQYDVLRAGLVRAREYLDRPVVFERR